MWVRPQDCTGPILSSEEGGGRWGWGGSCAPCSALTRATNQHHDTQEINPFMGRTPLDGIEERGE